MRITFIFILVAALSFTSRSIAADEVDVAAVIKQLEKKVDPKGKGDLAYTASTHERLAGWLPHLDRNDRLDGELLANARAFAEGDINAQVFLLYLREAHLKSPERRQRFMDLSAKGGDRQAMFDLALMYLHGEGKKLDLEEGIKWLRQAAKASHMGAMNLMGDFCRLGHGGLPRNDSEAADWYRGTSARGSAWGALHLGEMILNGRRDDAKLTNGKDSLAFARQEAIRGAGKGDVECMYVLAYLLIDDGDQGLEKDYESALKWYRKAAAAGHSGAMNTLAYLYHKGLGVPQDSLEALKWWTKAAALKQVDAIQWLARLFRDGDTVGQDHARAMKYYMEAVELGSSFAMNEVGFMYDMGLGVRIDYERAMAWYLKAASMNHAMGTSNVGMLHGFGKGVPRDVKEAMVWWRRAADLGVPQAMVAMAEQYTLGEVVEKDEAKAMEWMRKAAAKGHQPAIEWLKKRAADE
ncbi:MAG: tetratricopeptide repeat protein [Phycisphaeraceae bacterium]